MKCSRCQNDVPVLTPSPEGDQDLCEDCYATAYRERMGRRNTPTGAIVSAVVLVLAVVAGAYLAFSGSNGDSQAPPEDDKARVSLDGPKKNVARSVKPRTRKKSRPKAKPPTERPPAPKKELPPEEKPPPEEEPPEEEEPPPEEEPPEEEPAPEEETGTDPPPTPQQIETPLYSLTPRASGPAGNATVSLLNVAEGEASSLAIEPRDGALCELSLTITVKDVTEAAEGVAIEGLVLVAGDAEFAPLHAKASSLPYAAPSADAPELATNAKIVLAFGAEQSGVEPYAEGGEIVELVLVLSGQPSTVPLKLLFDLPPDVTEASLFLGDQEVPVVLTR